MQIVIDIDDEQVLSDIKNRGLEPESETDKVILNALYNGKALEKQKKGQWLRMSDLSEQDDDRYECSYCGNVVHHKSKMNLYTFNRWCGRCGSDNDR